MRVIAVTLVVFLLPFGGSSVQPTGFRPWAFFGWVQHKPAAEAAGLNAESVGRNEAELEQTVRAQPDDWALHVELIEASAAAGHLPERTRWYEAWLTAEHNAGSSGPRRQATLHAALGTCYWRSGDLRAARSEYRQAVRLDPGNHAFTEARRTLEAQTGWQLRDTLIALLLVLFIVAYVALRRRRWMRALRD